jgi:predicted TIM-barrel fold metal-dependent hydrolase
LAVLSVRPAVDQLGLVDHHCHSVTGAELDRPGFEAYLTEAPDPAAAGGSTFDTQLGLAIRRWCAPVLDLDPHPEPEDYLARRAALGAAAANRLLLRAAGAVELLVDGGYQPAQPLAPDALATAATARVRPVLRLESVAEEVAAAGVPAAGYAAAFAERLAAAAATAVAVKSIAAYRTGLDLDPARPGPAEVTAAAGRWLAAATGPGRPRLADPVLTRHLLWAAVDLGLPLQLHTGFGDPDLRLHRADPALLSDFCAATAGSGTAIALLHCYPYHRQAAYLASVYPHVYLDVGLALNHVGARASAVLAETLELAPFGKLLYSSDAFGLAELYLLGALQFRRALSAVLGGWVVAGDLTGADADRYATMIGAGTARRLYRLDPP